MPDGSEALFRLAAFAGVFALVAAAEMAWPYRAVVSRGGRWACNIGLSLINTGVVRLLAMGLPLLPVGVALAFEGGGLFGLGGVPAWLAMLVGFVILDLAVYGQHVVFHHVPWLWRLHRVHHADTGFDVTTAIRFHPIEIVVSLAWKLVVIVAFGIPAVAVLVFEIVLNAGAMFSHANVSLPAGVERTLRTVFVTPDMHRVHHSVEPAELNSNFGFNFSVWDRLCGTYLSHTQADAREMPIGLRAYQIPETSRLGAMLVFPFRRGRHL
jgi:sterol desaturase/sphingolipid hydroxylase (fatty acid hydroxylase superfamily)